MPSALWADHALFNITLATHPLPNPTDRPFTADPIATCLRQLLRHNDDLAAIHSNILKSCFKSVRQFEHQLKNTICDCDFDPGVVVHVRNSSTEGGLFDDTVLNQRFVALCLVSNRACSHLLTPVTCLINCDDLAHAITDEDIIRADFRQGLTEDGQNFDPLAGVRTSRALRVP